MPINYYVILLYVGVDAYYVSMHECMYVICIVHNVHIVHVCISILFVYIIRAYTCSSCSHFRPSVALLLYDGSGRHSDHFYDNTASLNCGYTVLMTAYVLRVNEKSKEAHPSPCNDVLHDESCAAQKLCVTERKLQMYHCLYGIWKA